MPNINADTEKQHNYRNYPDSTDYHNEIITFTDKYISRLHIGLDTQRTDDLITSVIRSDGIARCENMTPRCIDYLLRIDIFSRKRSFDIRYHLFFNICTGIGKVICAKVKTVHKIYKPTLCISLCCIEVSCRVHIAYLIEICLKRFVTLGIHIVHSIYFGKILSGKCIRYALVHSVGARTVLCYRIIQYTVIIHFLQNICISCNEQHTDNDYQNKIINAASCFSSAFFYRIIIVQSHLCKPP